MAVAKIDKIKIIALMHPDFHVLSANDSMIEAASYSIMAERRISPVVDAEGKLIGILTRTCIKNALYNAIFPEKPINPINGGSVQGQENNKL